MIQSGKFDSSNMDIKRLANSITIFVVKRQRLGKQTLKNHKVIEPIFNLSFNYLKRGIVV